MASNTEKRITAKMVLDSTGYNDKLKGLNSEMKKHQAELKVASEGIKAFGKDSEKLKSVQESLAKQVELHSKKVNLYKDSIEKTSKKLEDNIKARDKLKSSLEQANKRYDEAVKMYGKESTEAKKAKAEVDRLSSEHKKAEKAVETNAKQVQNYETNLNKANAQMVKTQGELKKVNGELDKSNNKWVKASEGLKKHSEKLKNAGSKISSAGDSILKLTAPLAAGGIASLKFSTDFESSVAKVSTIADTTQVPIEGLRKKILELSDDTGIVATEIANNTYDSISAGQKTGDAINFVTNSTKLAKAGFAEAGQSLDVLTTIMNAYKMKAEDVNKVSDMLITTQNEGKVTVAELSSVMGKVIPTAVATNTNLKQVTAGYALMTKNGIKAAESTTYMNSMLNEMSKTGSKADIAIRQMTKKSFSQLMKEGKNLSDVLNIMDKHAKKNKLSLKDMFGSAEAGKAALVLSTNAGADFNEMLGKMEQSAGATGKAFDKVTNTRGEKFKKSLNKMKNVAIKFGDAIAPMMDKASDLIGKLADKLGSLSKEQMESYAKWGMMAIASGGALKILGNGLTTIGKVGDLVSKLTGGLGKASVATKAAEGGMALASGGIGKLGLAAKAGALLLNPWVLGVAAVGAVGVIAAKKLKEDAVPKIDLFADKVETNAKQIADANGQTVVSYETTTTKISESTKKNVGAYMKLDEGAKKHLDSLYLNNTIVTDKIKNETSAKYKEMGDQIVQGYDKQHAEQYKTMQEFFSKSTALMDKEEQGILGNLQRNNEDRKLEQQKHQKQIQDILNKASKDNRALREDERLEINNIQQKMKTNAIKALSATEVESKIILERAKEHDKRITADQAGEHIKKLNEQRDKSIKAAEDEHSKRMNEIIRMRDESKIISDDQAKALIKDSERQRDDTISNAKRTRNEAVNHIMNMNSDLKGSVNTATGEILSKWEKLKSWWNSWKPGSKNFTADIQYNNKVMEQKVFSGGKQFGVGSHWTGTNYFEGGLTTMHEKGYEVYSLARGSRIYNHEASEDLVMKTAESVATKVANRVMKGFKGNNGVNVTQNIYATVPTPSEMARQSKNKLRELALLG